MVLEEVPARLYGDACLRVALLTFFGSFVLCLLWAAARPGTVDELLGPGHMDTMRTMYADAPTDRHAADAVIMHGFYIANNVGIALGCFAAGIFLGVGSLVILLFNGVVLGLTFGGMIGGDPQTRGHFLTFVAAHGPWELVGIALAGAAGVRLGLGLVDGSDEPRLDRLRRSATEALPILGVAASLVALAAPIEAWVSPSSLPTPAKIGVGAACAVLLVVYLVVLGRRGRHAS
jgi:uncharacterized membrane protein SpoIIM required for sporulation